jgi:hypothetical protein
MATQVIPVTPLAATPPVTATRAPQTTSVPVPPTAPPSDDVDASTIADEVAEAIKRAFAGLG